MQTIPEELNRHDHIRAPEFALFAMVLTVAMIARIWNLSWSLPDVFEAAAPFEDARKFWGIPGGEVSLRPESFHYPALSMYIHFVIQAIRLLTGLVSGQFGSLDAFRSAMGANPGDFMVTARIVSALFDVGSVSLVWITAREVFGRWTAIGAALLAAVNPLLIAGAQGVNADVILTFFLMMTLRQSLKLSGHAGIGEFLLAGVFIGLAASTEYTGVLLLALPAFILAADFAFGTARTLRFLFREIGLALLIPIAAAAVFALLNPAVLTDQAGFLRDFAYDQHRAAFDGAGAGRGSAEFYLAGTLAAKLGVLFLGGAVAGVIVSFAGKNPGGVAIAAMAVIYIAVISTREAHAGLYLLPVIPLLSILCSAGSLRAMAWAAERSTDGPGLSALRPFVTRALPTAGLIAVLVVPALGAFRYHVEIGKTDTRSAAREWIQTNAAPRPVVASGISGLPLSPGGYTIMVIPSTAGTPAAAAAFRDARWYEDFDLLVAGEDDRSLEGAKPDRLAELMRTYDHLESGWILAAHFEPDSALRGPALWLFRPDSSTRADTFAVDLLARLATVEDVPIEARFIRELSGALTLRGKAEKSRQLLELGSRLHPAD